MARKRAPIGRSATARPSPVVADEIQSLPFEVTDQQRDAYKAGIKALGDLAKFAVGFGNPIIGEHHQYPTIRLKLDHKVTAKRTVINPLTNSRDQESLNIELLGHISGNWTGVNSTPAIARFVDDNIEVLAGSCRRLVAIELEGGYLVDVGFEVPETEARFAANSAESQMQQSAWERGNVALQMEQRDNVSRKEIAKRLNTDAGDLSKMMNAVEQLELESNLKTQFAGYRGLGIAALSTLGKAVAPIAADNRAKTKFYAELSKLTSGDNYAQLASEKRPAALVKLCRAASDVARGKAKPAKQPPVTTHIAGDTARKKAAIWMVSDAAKRSVTINATKLTAEQVEKLTGLMREFGADNL